ncbi:MAG: lipid-A-disaccharide synthase [Candidatus Binatia bacterium]|nr:lipid-A-disaccharide synthase [Candidatus Binatia bacterium]
MSARVLLVAGEASGDLRGAELVRELRALVPEVEVSGVGGERLRAAGMHITVPASDLSIMGFTEVTSRAATIVRSYRRLRDEILGRGPSGRKPDLVVLIDFPDFNLRLAAVAKRVGVPVFYYVSPQVWAWRRYRIKTLARRVDRLAVVFPFEEELYRGLADVTFVGHPALTTVHSTRSREETREVLGVEDGKQLVAILPGSRQAEVRELLPPMRGSLELLSAPVHGVVALADESLRTTVEELAPDLPRVVDETYDLVAAADLVLVASGSASLETALLGRPMVICYRLSGFSYAVARALVRVPFFGMPNLVLHKRAVPELLQSQVTPERIAAEARLILDDPARGAEIEEDLRQVRARLGKPGAAGRAAKIAADMMFVGSAGLR